VNLILQPTEKLIQYRDAFDTREAALVAADGRHGACHAGLGAEPQRRTSPYASGPSWTGFYLGAAFGGTAAVEHTNGTNNGVTFSNQGVGGSGVLASIYGGYDMQVLPKALVGVLAEGTWASPQASVSAQAGGANANVTSQPDWGVALLARAGILASPSTLLYFTGGYAGQNFHTTATAVAPGAFASFNRNDWYNGWTVGAGLESKLRGAWSAKLEYRYTQFGALTVGNVTDTPSLHAVRAGLTYKFGEAAAAPADEAPVSRSMVNWTGPYVGVEAGVAASVTRLTATAGAASVQNTEGGQSLLGGGFGGFDYQMSDQFVVGVLGEIAAANPQTTNSIMAGGASTFVTVSPAFSWSAMARLGWLASPTTLLYATGGYTGEAINTNASAFAGGAMANFSSYNVLSGWTVGPGIEARIADGWSTKLEYRYSEYGTQTLLPGVTLQPSTHTVRLGLAYKFPVPSSSQ
jgi:outer membrane immunogenic protein